MTPDSAPIDGLAAFLAGRGFVGVPLHVNAVGHFEIAAEVNGHAARLVLDTGASHTVFDTPSAERFGLQTTPTAERARSVGAADYAAARSLVAELRLGDARLREVAVRAFDLGHVNRALEARGGMRVDGAIGGDVLRSNEAIIDYARAMLYLHGSAAAP